MAFRGAGLALVLACAPAVAGDEFSVHFDKKKAADGAAGMPSVAAAPPELDVKMACPYPEIPPFPDDTKAYPGPKGCPETPEEIKKSAGKPSDCKADGAGYTDSKLSSSFQGSNQGCYDNGRGCFIAEVSPGLRIANVKIYIASTYAKPPGRNCRKFWAQGEDVYKLQNACAYCETWRHEVAHVDEYHKIVQGTCRDIAQDVLKAARERALPTKSFPMAGSGDAVNGAVVAKIREIVVARKGEALTAILAKKEAMDNRSEYTKTVWDKCDVCAWLQDCVSSADVVE